MVNVYFPSGNMERLGFKENFEKLVKSGMTYEVISKELKYQNPDCCDLSVRLVRRFCRDHQIDEKSLLEKEKLDSILKEEML